MAANLKIDKPIYDVIWSIFEGDSHGVATLLPLCVYLVTLVWSWTWPFVNIILVTPPGSRSPIILTFYISHSDTELSLWRCQTLYTLPSNPRPLKLTGLWALAVRCTNLGRTCHTRYEKSQQLRNYESDYKSKFEDHAGTNVFVHVIALHAWSEIILKHIQYGWRPPFRKSLWGHNSAADGPTRMKFGMPTQKDTSMTMPEAEF